MHFNSLITSMRQTPSLCNPLYVLLWMNSVVALFVNSRRWSCVIPDKKLYGNCLYWCKDVRDFDGATQWVIATVPGRRVWLSTPACAIVAVRLGKALKDAHGALKEAKQSARPCDPLLLKIAQSHYNQSRLWSRSVIFNRCSAEN